MKELAVVIRQLQTLALALPIASGSVVCAAPAWVEYPGHPTTYGDHALSATWSGGPVPRVTVELQTDETILHADGIGQSQRTARNTLTYAPPSSPANPQDYDNLGLVLPYGPRLPLLQHMAADGTSMLTYRFPAAVGVGFDLYVTDVDSSDMATVRAFSLQGAPADMAAWRIVAQGDLSLYKNTGAAFSAISAPPPVTTTSMASIQLTAVNSTNFNRSFTILRAPADVPIERVEIEFTGVFNSPDRAGGGEGSHIYVALSTIPRDADFDADSDVDFADLSRWQANFGDNSLGDADADADSDGEDFLQWQRQYGSDLAAVGAAQVPEPTTALFFSEALLAAAFRRRSAKLRRKATDARFPGETINLVRN